MSKYSKLCLMIWILLCEIVASEDRLFLDPPTIATIDKKLSTVETLYEFDSHFSMTCASEYPITWKPFKGFTGSYKIEFRDDSKGHYESTIHWTNISYHYVGYFYCVANVTQYDYDYSSRFDYEYFDERISGLSRIYIFVNVPCKPTSNSVNVLLFENGEQLHPDRFHGLQDKVGFLIRFSSVDEIYGRTFTCLPRRSDTHLKMLFSVRYHVPVIESASGLYATKGDQLNLNCSIVILKGETIAISWTLPNASLESRIIQSALRIVDHPTKPYLQLAVSEIVIMDVDFDKDEGTYECEAIDELQSKSVDRIVIEILEKGDDSVDIHALDGIYRTEISNWKTAIWKVKYKGNPKPTSLEWYDTSDKILRRRYNKEYDEIYDYDEYYEYDQKYEVEITNQYAMLKIKFVRFEYSGFYTLRVANDFSSIEKKFELRVKVSPHQDIVNNMVVSSNEIVKFVCNCTGYPLSRITWTFTPCDLNEMRETAQLAYCKAKQRSIEAKYVHTTSQSLTNQTSVFMFNATETGKVKCTAVNTEGRVSREANLYVTDIENERFGIWGLSDETQIIAGDNVTVVCAVSIFTGSYVKWFRNGERLESNDGMRIGNLIERRLREETISWNNITTSHSGTYECCMTKYLSSHILALKTLNVKVYEPQAPVVDDTSRKDTIELQLDEPIQLTCNIIGHPLPKFEWFKNGELLWNGTEHRLSADMKTLDITATEFYNGSEFKCIGTNRFGSVYSIVKLIVTKESSKLAWIVGAIVLTLTLILISVSI